MKDANIIQIVLQLVQHCWKEEISNKTLALVVILTALIP
jgi:hypothetical protein